MAKIHPIIESTIQISVIIPTYNRIVPLKRCLDALARQDFPAANFEVIIVDDGSMSRLDKAVSGFRERLQLRLMRQSHSGPGKARNSGARYANGAYLIFIDDDCIPSGNWLAVLERGFRQFPDCMLGGHTINATPVNRYSTVSQMIIDYLYKQYNKDPKNARFFTGNHLAISAEGFRALSGFAAETFELAAGEDRDFCARWLMMNRRMIYIPEAVIRHANDLTPVDFVRQQIRYGRGAFLCYRSRDKAYRQYIKPNGIIFYRDLILYPTKKISGLYSIFYVLLILMSQCAVLLGFCFEVLNSMKKRSQEIIKNAK